MAALVVEGVNRVYKHVRRSQKNPQGGRLSKEMPVQISNVLLVCTAAARASAPASRVAKDGSKERFCKKCGGGLGDDRARQREITSGAGLWPAMKNTKDSRPWPKTQTTIRR